MTLVCRCWVITVLVLIGLPYGSVTVFADQSWQSAAMLPQPLEEPKRGAFLVATSDMPDPRFQRSVILLVAHGKRGTLGIIVNRQTSVSLQEAMPDLEDTVGSDHKLFFGGPVAIQTLVFLIRDKMLTDQSEAILNNVYLGSERTYLEEALAQDLSPQHLRIYFGRAGWAPGQLDAELTAGGWQLFQANAEMVFHKQPDTLWEALMDPESRQLLVRRHAP